MTNMADVGNKIIGDEKNIDAVINTTKSVDEEQILQFISSTIQQEKAKKKDTCKDYIFKICKKILMKISMIKTFQSI